jgi:kynurenine formamidase
VILSRKYSHTDPPFFEDAALFLHESGIKHLLIDLPSVDKEKDEGKTFGTQSILECD